MIGWTPRPFIFVHIPKCAGTSIETALIPMASGHQGFEALSEDERTRFWLPCSRGLQHSKLRRFESQYKLDDFFTFAFVRNPWERAISQIEYLRARTGGWLFPGSNIKEHLYAYCHATVHVEAQDLGACQLDYLVNAAGQVELEFVGRFESLPSDFDRICRALGIASVPTLPHIFNSRRIRHYSAYYDTESAGWVRDRFARDIDYFGYRFESAKSQLLNV